MNLLHLQDIVHGIQNVMVNLHVVQVHRLGLLLYPLLLALILLRQWLKRFGLERLYVVHLRSNDQFKIVTGPVSIPLTGLSVKLCAYTVSLTVNGSVHFTSP